MNGLEQIVDGVEQKAKLSNRINEGDYIGEDGLWVCGKCHTPKQARVRLFGKERTPMCLCKCAAEQLERERIAQESLNLELEYDSQKHKTASNVDLLHWLNRQNYRISPKLTKERISLMRSVCFGEDEKLKNWTFANADGSNATLMSAMQNYVDNFQTLKEQGKGLLLFGDVGIGKSYAAASVANALIDKGISVYMTNFARIANTVQGMFEEKQDYYDSLNRFQLLILDDLAAERKTEYMQEIVFQVIDARCRAGLPLIITTNLTNKELKNPTETAYKRTFSRLLGMCHPIKVEGEDKRKNRLKDDFQAMNDLLGI